MAKISDEERREVAENLRMCARNTSGTHDLATYLRYWVGIGDVTDDEGKHFTVAAERRCAERTLEKLADLIDRPICKNLANQHDGSCFECSECGERWELTCGSPADNHLNYCPNCGARVVSGDD